MKHQRPEDLRPEIALLLACARTTYDDRVKARIAELLRTPPDWTYLVQTAIDHGVSPLLCRAMLQVFPDAVPDDVRAAAKTHLDDNDANNRSRTSELLRILAALAQKNVAAIPFKGPAVAERIYGDLSLRRFRDLDFLLREADIDAALDVLRQLDYPTETGFVSARDPAFRLTPAQTEAFREYAGEYIFYKRDQSAVIEPHWHFAPATLSVDIDYTALWRRTFDADLAGATVRTLTPEDELLMLCIHGSKEIWTRLQWICDVAELIRAYPSLNWVATLQRAERQGCERMLLLGLSLANRLLQALLPPTVRKLTEQPAVSALARDVERALFADRGAPTSIYAVSLFRIRMRERLRDRWRYVWRTVTTPRIQHFEMIALPDALFFGYVPIKLIHDYVLLPLWLLAKRLRTVATATANRPVQSGG